MTERNYRRVDDILLSSPTSRPTNASFDLLFDNRTGEKLEIVVPILNEERRIHSFISYYSDFDLVFLDGGSTDQR